MRGRSACGLTTPRLTTSQPRYVTCQVCARTLAMADAEIRASLRKSRNQAHRKAKGL